MKRDATKFILSTLFCLTLCLQVVQAGEANDDSRVLSLAGQWRFRLDLRDVGRDQKWFKRNLPDRIALPGTTDEAGFGTRTVGSKKGRLTRVHEHIGAAWYQRDVTIPESWHGKRITLLLERCLWRTEVWMDDKPAGTQDSLCASHVYNLSEVNPGRHTLTIRVDNSPHVNIGNMGHSYTEQTQSIWNGIVGRIELRATDSVWMQSVKIFPDAESGKVRLLIEFGNETGRKVSGILSFLVKASEAKTVATERTVDFAVSGGNSTVEVELSAEKKVRPWDEFSPALYTLDVSLGCKVGVDEFSDHRREVFGFRKIGHDGKQITINDRPTFLRGTIDCAAYPLTGYPPMDVAAWRRIFGIVKSHGLNHVRFHSWCPPEAAFVAADRAGLILQIETPTWIDGWMATGKHGAGKCKLFGQDPQVVEFIQQELVRILDAYGNHPSFCMMSIGNEIGDGSDYAQLAAMIGRAKRNDPRRLYAVSTARQLTPADDFYVTHRTPGGASRGLRGPTNSWDFRGPAMDRVNVPLIAHEIGQWAVYPDYGQIGKYTGVLRARNLEGFRDSLAARGMANQAKMFQQATGALAWRLYKAEMEAMLRTPKFGGFQLLSLNDFPGQGEAPVGMLDVFWNSKDLINPDAFRRFCSETVPLLRFGKYVWMSDETFTGQAQIAHYGPKPLRSAEGFWSVKDDTGRQLASGKFQPSGLPVGDVTTLGEITLPLSSFQQATRLTVTLSLKGTSFINDWDIWVYPKQVDISVPKGVIVSERFDEATREALAQGKKVLLLSPVSEPHPKTIQLQFLPVFWSHIFCPWGPGTLGILCDPKHPALTAFPTEFHGNWQWWALVAQSSKANAFILDGTPADFRPIVQVVDDFHRNHKLGAIFETRVGRGKLLVCGFDLKSDLDNRPAARQMLLSLLTYMQSKHFSPKETFEPELLGHLLGGPPPAKTMTAPESAGYLCENPQSFSTSAFSKGVQK